MLWINSSEIIVRFTMDIGNGRELHTVLPSQTIDLPIICTKAVGMEAPHLTPYVPTETLNETLDVLPEQLNELVAKKKPGRKPKGSK